MKYYDLTESAEEDFREAKTWSKARWGKELTARYFSDLHTSAEHAALYRRGASISIELTEDITLYGYSAREHYLIYIPVADDRITIVALIRQGRDIVTILRSRQHRIQNELEEIQDKVKQNDN